MSDAALATELMARRLDRVAAHALSGVLRLDPEEVDGLVDDLLAQIGEALGTDRVVFESYIERASGSDTRVWTRGESIGADTVLTIPVAVSSRRLGVLSVGPARSDEAWPSPVADRLRVLADSLVLTVQRGEELRVARRRHPAPTPVAAALPCDPHDDANEFEEIIGDSPALRIAMRRVLDVAPTDASVILLGETGTGKELFARAVHSRSRRRSRAFVRVNCAALPPTLIESELFGHERGAFTGAVTMRQGRFELAHQGTLFLDEIGDLPADVQAKLLRVLQEGEFERVGSSQSRKVDVRIIAATHQDLAAAVKDGRFRADLYYRLSVFPIALPPLRERIEDIERLVWCFINRRQRALNRRFTTIPAGVLTALQQHAWPGNVRELENVVERAMIHSKGDTLLLDEGPTLPLWTPARESGTLEAVERRHIENVLRRCRGRINGPGNAADTLGIHPNTLRFRMKKLGIERPRELGVLRAFGQRSA
jgi:transcriptional regulator with GAF, ATPase, and Fis domain